MTSLWSTLSSRLGLVVPFGIALALILVQAIYWFVVAGQIENRAQTQMETLRAAGYTVSDEGLRISGYPFRFTVTSENARIGAPPQEGGWTAQIDQIVASAQFYNLSHWIVSLGNSAVLDVPYNGRDERYELSSENARFSVVLRNQRTSRIGAEILNLSIASDTPDGPWVESVERAILNGFVDSDDVFQLRVQAENTQMGQNRIPESVSDEFGRTAELVRIQAQFSQWSALATANPARWYEANGQLTVERAQLVWGAADLQGMGDIALDSALLPEGRLSLVVTDPNTLITALVRSGLVYEEQGEALRLFALMAPRRETGIALPFRLQHGALFLGPARLGGIQPPNGDETPDNPE